MSKITWVFRKPSASLHSPQSCQREEQHWRDGCTCNHSYFSASATGKKRMAISITTPLCIFSTSQDWENSPSRVVQRQVCGGQEGVNLTQQHSFVGGGGCPLHCRMFSHTPDLYLLQESSSCSQAPVKIMKNISRHCKYPLGGKKPPRLENRWFWPFILFCLKASLLRVRRALRTLEIIIK